MPDDKDITNAVLLQHMQGMKAELKEDIAKLDKRITGLEKKVGVGFSEMKHDIGAMKNALQRLYERRMETTQRLDHIEQKELPRIKKAIGLAA